MLDALQKLSNKIREKIWPRYRRTRKNLSGFIEAVKDRFQRKKPRLDAAIDDYERSLKPAPRDSSVDTEDDVSKIERSFETATQDSSVDSVCGIEEDKFPIHIPALRVVNVNLPRL